MQLPSHVSQVNVRHAVAEAVIDFHRGETLMRLAGTYPTLQLSIKETVQNALDSGATKISVVISRKTRTYIVTDNGEGASQAKFNLALSSVGRSIKPTDKLGRFGLGVISPLGKCDLYTFKSCAKPHEGPFIEWTLRTADIRQQKETIKIPMRTRSDFVHRPGGQPTRGVTPVWWRTEVAVINFTDDRLVSSLTLEGLEQEILNSYSEVMLRNRVSISMELIDEKGESTKKVVRAAPFQGKPMQKVTYDTKDGGTIQFSMYLVRSNNRSSKVNIRFGELYNDFRFSWPNFLRYNGADFLASETVEAFKSGVFEGEILAQHAKLTPQRTCFDKNDALLDLCDAMDHWFKEYGKQKLDEEKLRRSESRYQELGIKSMKVLEDLLHRPENESLLKAIREGFGYGTIGVGHTDVSQKIKDGLHDDPSLSVRGGVGVSRTSGGNGKGGSGGNGGGHSSKDKVERPRHVPLSVSGPNGQVRMLVKGNSVGLHFDYQDFGATPALWKLDREKGVLTFNITHPIWVECDKEKKDWKVCALQEFVATQALTLEIMPDRNFYEQQRLFADEMVRRFTHLLATGAISKSLKVAP